ncbi:MAG: DUF192 domain-containing protein [Candidatus Diapherotrites archaeon]|nr:DUF192 domain-containing protein [Candidatus Diapherotrites archaeon]
MMRCGKRVIARRVEEARSALQKAIGLMFRKSFDGAHVLFINSETRVGASIHMMFMRFPIDVVFLDSKKRVVDVRRDVKPWVLNVTPNKPAKYVVELPAGKADVKVGECVEW